MSANDNYRGDPIRRAAFVTRVQNECDKALKYCGFFYATKQTVTRAQKVACITEQKEAIMEKFPDNEEAAARIIDKYIFDIPHMALGGKRKRRTMHRKRVNNRSRRNRRVH
jgi:hypothetical protein